MPSTPSDAEFCQALPKLECHAHLNGSIPDHALAELIHRKTKDGLAVNADLADFELPDTLATIEEFFPIFTRSIYRLTDTPDSIKFATASVLQSFCDQGCMYLELRTTLRRDPSTGLTFRSYLEAVLSAFEDFEATPLAERGMIARLIVSIDWRHTSQEAQAISELAIEHATCAGKKWVVGVDVCGDPSKSDPRAIESAVRIAKAAGLGLTIHFAEIAAQRPQLEACLALQPDRLGHATFLTPEIQKEIIRRHLPIEICITSNIAAKTVSSIDSHHLQWAVKNDVPVLICTDDVLIFRNDACSEYLKALSLIPGGREELLDIVRKGIDVTFSDQESKDWMKKRLEAFVESKLPGGPPSPSWS